MKIRAKGLRIVALGLGVGALLAIPDVSPAAAAAPPFDYGKWLCSQMFYPPGAACPLKPGTLQIDAGP